MSIRAKIKARGQARMTPHALTGQIPILDKAKAFLINLKVKIDEKRPGAVIPKAKTSLMGPSGLAIDHERVLPQRLRDTNMGIDYDA